MELQNVNLESRLNMAEMTTTTTTTTTTISKFLD